ncbi:MAG: ClpXP protease specificity-enhancing factor [Gammaproteobacteria bacterium]|nr:MAG: ClpXP protease specificity-enhancing factor [Gammaproteobacteria bacterium]
MNMTSNRPYLIRAFYDWIVDNQCTPYMVVDAYFPGVEVPQEHVNDGQIVLNVAPRAVAAFVMNNEQVAFSTRFGGVPSNIRLPIQSITGIYARENGQGMVFQPEKDTDPDPQGPGPNKPTAVKEGKAVKSNDKTVKPSLRVVK